jgi:type IV secretory pathway VirB2 component (pilin)
MNAFFKFMASTAGRIARIIAGLVLIALGIWAVSGIGGWILVIIGLVPLLAGLFDRCVFAPLAKLPFNGADLRAAVED